MLFDVAPKFCISIVFSFSWELKWPQEKLKTMLMQNFGGTNKEHYGMLWYFWSGQLRNPAWRSVFTRFKCLEKRKNNLEKNRFVLHCKLTSVLYKRYITQYMLSFSIIWWISFWTSAHWASFGCLQLCNISNPKKPGDYRVLYLPQVPVNARVNRKPTLVDPCIFAVHPCSSDTRRLFEHMHVKHIQFTCEMSSRRESCSSGSDHTHSQELPHSFIRGMFSS